MYHIEYLEDVVKNDIPNLPKTMQERIRKSVEQRLQVNPIEFGKPLQYSLKGCRRLRVGNYRATHRIENSHTVLIVKIGHRKEIYDNSSKIRQKSAV